MAENQLDIVLKANIEQFSAAVRDMQVQAKAVGDAVERNLSGVGDSISENIGKGAKEAVSDLEKAGKDGADSFDKVGDGADDAADEIKQAFAQFARTIENARKESLELAQQLERVGDQSQEITQLKNQLTQLEKKLEKAGDAAKSIDFQTAVESAEELAGAVDAATEPFVAAAERARNLKRSIQQTFGDPKEADAFLKKAQEIKAEFGDLVDEDDLARSAQILGTLKVPVDDFARAAKVAKAAGRDVEDGAQDLGEALAALGSGNADLEVLDETLRTNFGISAEALRNYGAVVDSTGKILARTKGEQKKAQEALRAYIDQSDRFNNIAGRTKDAQSELRNELDKFNRAVGDNVNELKNYVAGGLLDLVKRLNDLPDGAKKAAAGIALIAAPLASVAALTLKVAGALKFFGFDLSKVALGTKSAAEGVGGLSGKLKDLLPRLKNFATGAAGSALVLGALAVAAYKTAEASNDWVDSLKDVDKAQSGLIDTQARALRQDKDILKLRGQSIDSIREQAKAFDDFAKQRILLTQALLEAQDALTTAESTGDKEAIRAAKDRLIEAQSARSEADSNHAIEIKQSNDRAKAKEEEFKRAQEAYNAFKIKYDAGSFDSQQKALASLKVIAQSLSGAPLEQAKADIRKLNKEVLDDNLDRIEKEFEAGKISAQKAKQLLSSQLSLYQANLDQRRDAYEDFKEKEEKVNEERLRNQQKYLSEALNAEKNSIKERAALIQSTSKLDGLERQLEAGKNVINQYKAEASEQTKKLKGLADEEAALERIAIAREKAASIKESPKDSDLINDAAEKKLREVNDRLAAQKAKLDQDLANTQAKAEEKRLKAQEEAQKKAQEAAKKTAETEAKAAAVSLQRLTEEQAASRENLELRKLALDEEERRGRNVAIQRQALAKEELELQRANAQERLKLIEEEIEAKRKAENVGATDAEKEVNNEEARLAVIAAQRAEREKQREINLSNIETIRAEVAEEEKKLKALQDQNKERQKAKGGGFSIETDFGASDSATGFGDSFGRSNLGGARDEDGRTAQDVERDLSRKKVDLSRAEEEGKAAGVFTDPALLQQGEVQSDLLRQLLSSNETMAQGLVQGFAKVAQAFAAANSNPSQDRDFGSQFARSSSPLPGSPR